MTKVYILHEYGAKSHFRSLDKLLEDNGAALSHYEFSIFWLLLRSIYKRDVKLFAKQFENLRFLASLAFSKDKKIVIGIAPFDFRLILYRMLLARHHVYYFTSWHDWSGGYYPKRPLSRMSLVRNTWKSFLEKDLAGVFAVTKTTLSSIKKHYNITAVSSVVYHSFNDSIFRVKPGDESDNLRKKMDCVFLGRLEPQKGIHELLNIAASTSSEHISFHFIGMGSLQNEITQSQLYGKSIFYHGYVDNPDKLSNLLNKFDVLLLPSKKMVASDNQWEELFGIAIIECMACGLVPIATDHVGPKEIIESGENGYLISEAEIVGDTLALLRLLWNEPDTLDRMKKSAVLRAQTYTSQVLANNWKQVLKPI